MTEKSTKEALGRDVSRETFDRLTDFEALVSKWSPRINLVSRGDIQWLWPRHILDSLQLFELAPAGFRSWTDIGSGGGFPGIVLAILMAEFTPDATMTLIESDTRKATFLRTAVRELGLSAEVVADRIEKVDPTGADMLSARALAPLSVLLAYAQRHLEPENGLAVFPKGKSAPEEISAAKENWRFDLGEVESRTDPNATILLIRNIKRAGI